MHKRRYEFVVTINESSFLKSCDWICSLGEHDDGAPIATGATPQEAMAEWLELYGDTLENG